MKNKFIKFFALIFAIIISISCGNEITPPENDNEIGTVIVIDTSKTYTVRLGSIVTNIKPSDMTNAWKDYIGGKKVLKPDGKPIWDGILIKKRAIIMNLLIILQIREPILLERL